MKRKENKVFGTSLYEIDRIIKDRKPAEPKDILEIL
jgi:hypothetical protein